MVQKRSKNLSDTDVAEIVGILDGWSGKLSWELFVQAIERKKFALYTRQALHKHERVRHAFSLRKRSLAGTAHSGKAEASSPELEAAFQRTARLEGEIARLKAENQQLLEQFARWAYNARTRGLGKDILNRSLPAVNRDQTRQKRLTVLPRREGG
ncbi:hypothetical protein H7F35_14175 [Variovorax sp. PAMC26660]|nr:hypothetical protein H7F35_14175 [Variovorax sp. PAMC26660]